MDHSNASIVLAADVGGTRSRVLLAPADPVGEITHEVVLGPGANIRSSGADALDQLGVTVAQALERAGVSGAQVQRAALGIAGAGAARYEEIARGVRERLAALGIDPERVIVEDDQITAFLSGQVGDDGLLLLAGTGAVAVRYRGRRAIERRDGMGWLLGDVGSAVWLARRILEAVAADLDHRGRRTRLTETLGEMLGLDLRDGIDSPTGDVRQDLIRAIDGIGPAELGRFAPLCGTSLPDEVAREILDEAARHFAHQVRQLDPDCGLPVVLAGSVLATDGPIHEELVVGLESSGRTVRIAADGLAGALALARETSG